MRENICEWSNRQKVNLQDIYTAQGAQYKKHKQYNQKMDRRSKEISLQRRHTDGQKACERTQHHSLLDKRKPKPQWGAPHTGQDGHHQKSTNNKLYRGCREKRTRLYCLQECKLILILRKIYFKCSITFACADLMILLELTNISVALGILSYMII